MNICIVTAMAEEVNALQQGLSCFNKKGNLCYASGDINIYLIKCGVLFRKPKRLERKLDILKKSDIVILCGISGAVSKKLKIGDIVIPDKIISLNNKRKYFINNNPEYLKDIFKKSKLNVINGGVLATSDHFVSTEEKEKMSSVDIVDM
ncbi:hypothetical protein J7L67_03605, partial [bacterium]|nr:hypothetical protein [bacterium]